MVSGRLIAFASSAASLFTILPLSGQAGVADSAGQEQRFFDWTGLQFAPEEYRVRRDAVTRQLRQSGGGVLLVPSAEGTSHGDTFRQLDDFYYLTGLELPRSLLAIDVDANRTLLFVPARDARFESASRPNDFPGRRLADDPDLPRISGIRDIVPWETLDSWLAIWATGRQTFRINPGSADSIEFLRTQPISSWSPEQQLIFHLQRTWPSVSIVSAYPEIARVRMRKSPAEIDVMRRAASLTARAIAAAAHHIEPGVEERRLEGEFISACKAGGAQRVPFTPIVKSGPNSLWPWRILAAHYDRRNRTMLDGDLVIFDVGCELDSYVSDVGRTFPVSGSFTDEQRSLLTMITRVSDAVIDAVRPAVTLADLQAVADATIPPDQKRYMQTGFFIGHHLGLSTGDPSLRHAPLEPGMIFTVEPWYYNHDREVAVFIEDEVLVTETGAEVLTASLPRSPEALEKMVAGAGSREP